MKISQFLLLSTGLLLSGNVLAAEGEALFRKNNCAACHQAARKSVGPALKDIASKYRGDASAQAKLEAKVRKGGAGNWGSLPMAPTPASVSDADIKAMVSWILAIQ